MLSVCSKNKNLGIVQEIRAKSAIKLSIKIQPYVILYIDLKIFCERLSEKTSFTSTLVPDSLEFLILEFFCTFQVFHSVKVDF